MSGIIYQGSTDPQPSSLMIDGWMSLSMGQWSHRGSWLIYQCGATVLTPDEGLISSESGVGGGLGGGLIFLYQGKAQPVSPPLMTISMPLSTNPRRPGRPS